MMVTRLQLYEYTKTTELHTLRGQILYKLYLNKAVIKKQCLVLPKQTKNEHLG